MTPSVGEAGKERWLCSLVRAFLTSQKWVRATARSPWSTPLCLLPSLGRWNGLSPMPRFTRPRQKSVCNFGVWNSSHNGLHLVSSSFVRLFPVADSSHPSLILKIGLSHEFVTFSYQNCYLTIESHWPKSCLFCVPLASLRLDVIDTWNHHFVWIFFSQIVLF